MTQPTAHAADTHDVIRVEGARENNLRDITVHLPKRRLTVFTGVSGSGKSSLVFDTIAAESQRMINETYPAFVQGFKDRRRQWLEDTKGPQVYQNHAELVAVTARASENDHWITLFADAGKKLTEPDSP